MAAVTGKLRISQAARRNGWTVVAVGTDELVLSRELRALAVFFDNDGNAAEAFDGDRRIRAVTEAAIIRILKEKP